MSLNKIEWSKQQLDSKFGDKNGAIKTLLYVIDDLNSKYSELELKLSAQKSKPAKKPAAKKTTTRKRATAKK
jgi:hypothetical protein|tara:strand:- start:21 stop:236 length:216 start_codon:yes stop_codon:yes gene_type:complete